MPAALAVTALVVCALAGEWNVAPGFLVAGALSAGLGRLLMHRPRAAPATSPPLAMVTVALAWLAIALLSTVPFLVWGWTGSDPARRAFGDFPTAFFEAMSGITSTGLTMARDPSQLPKAIQWWRSALEWIGGVGVVVLAMALVHPAETGRSLFSAEARDQRIGPTFRSTARRILVVFGIATAAAVGALGLAGMPWWEALNHGMTGIATGGFSVTSDGFAGYGVAVRIVTVAVILIGSVSFSVHSALLFDRDPGVLRRDDSTRALAVLFALGVGALVLFDLRFRHGASVMDLAFQWASALGTCGFSTEPLATWNAPSILLLTLGMFIGGASGSTTGGIKISRAVLLVRGMIWHLRRRLLPRKGAVYYRIDGESVREPDAFRRYRNAVALASLFAAEIVVATLVLLFVLDPAPSPRAVLFEVTSAISNVGLSVGITGPDLPAVAKGTLITLMWTGRLEILSVLVLLGAPLVLARRAGK